MDKAAIYYFSGTGNSLYLAKEAARHLDAALVPIAAAVRSERISPDADVVGIVYPVYYNDLPVVVRDFTGKLRGIENKYVFAVCNYGGCGSQSVKSLGEIIRSGGGELAAAFGIHMPQNAFLKSWENNDKTIRKAGLKIGRIAAVVKAGKKGIFLKGLLDFIFIRAHRAIVPKVKATLAQKAGLTPDDDLAVLIRASDRGYHTNDQCSGCGLCAKVCPVGNIFLESGRPKWLGRCENCLACYDWCPNKAVEGSVAAKGYYYVNPKIKAAEIMAQSVENAGSPAQSV